MRGRGVASFSPEERERIRALVAARNGTREIAAEMGVSRQTIVRAVKAFDLGPWRTRTSPTSLAAIPAAFARAFPTSRHRQLSQRFGVCRETVARWGQMLGLQKHREPAMPTPRKRAPVTSANVPRLPGTRRQISETIRNMTVVGQAADYLRRYGAVYRCNERGGAVDTGGTHWRRGSAVLTDDELIARAARLGFDPNGWRRLAA